MNVQELSGSTRYTKASAIQQETAKEAKETKEAKEKAVSTATQDRVVKSESDKTGIYQKPSTDRSQVMQQIKEDQARRSQELVNLVRSMIVGQGEKSNLTLFGQRLNVTPQQSADAAASIAEGGEYSVDAVATRIMSMAEALSGGDPSKFQVLRDAVEKGFGEARKVWGGELPDISNRTYDEIMKRFDDLMGKNEEE